MSSEGLCICTHSHNNSPARHRSVDGSCNNLDNPHWGAARNTHQRFLSPDYADGISAPRVSSGGFPLPNTRKVSSMIHKDSGNTVTNSQLLNNLVPGFHDHAVTVMLVAWGQFMDHDFTLTAETRASERGGVGILPITLFQDPKTGKTPECCDVGLEGGHHNCLPISIPEEDHFYSLHKKTCMNFVRVEAGVRLVTSDSLSIAKLRPRLDLTVASVRGSSLTPCPPLSTPTQCTVTRRSYTPY